MVITYNFEKHLMSKKRYIYFQIKASFLQISPEIESSVA